MSPTLDPSGPAEASATRRRPARVSRRSKPDSPPPEQTAGPAGRPEGRLVLEDPVAIRALAHPARLTIIDELYAQPGERTASELAELVGLTPSATSYHLRALAKHGLVVRAEARGDGRERPWRAAAGGLQIDSRHPAVTDAAEAVLLDQVLGRLREQWSTWTAQRDQQPEWQDAATLSRSRVWVDAAEAQSLADAMAEQVKAWADRPVGDRPPGARAVQVVWSLVPYADRPTPAALASSDSGDGDE